MIIRKIDFQKVEILRLRLGITLTEFCRVNGIDHKTYRNLSNGSVKDKTIIKLSKALDIDPEEILIFENDETVEVTGSNPVVPTTFPRISILVSQESVTKWM